MMVPCGPPGRVRVCFHTLVLHGWLCYRVMLSALFSKRACIMVGVVWSRVLQHVMWTGAVDDCLFVFPGDALCRSLRGCGLFVLSLCPTRESCVRRAGYFPGGPITGVPCLLAVAISVHLHAAAHGSRSPYCLPDLCFGVSDRITGMTLWCIGRHGYIIDVFFCMHLLFQPHYLY